LNKNGISIAFAIEWNSGMESSASDKLFVLEGLGFLRCGFAEAE
jgi:hypothetical protein